MTAIEYEWYTYTKQAIVNKTIYVRDEDVSLWNRAKELAGDKLAPVIMDGLRSYVIGKERERQGFERIELHFRDSQTNNLPTAKAFFGRWIFPREKPLSEPCSQVFEIIAGATDKYAIAQTAKNRFAVLSWRERQQQLQQLRDNFSFRIFEDLDDLKNSALSAQLKAAVMEKLGVQVEELDI